MKPEGVRLRPLWRQGDFLAFWGGQTVSMVGSRVTALALPLTAIVTLHASPAQIGVLGASGSAASLVCGLPAGVWVDRVRRRPLLIAANVGQAALLISVPVAAWLGALGLLQLYAVSFLAASLAVVFNAARASYLPSIVPRKQLVQANSALSMSGSMAQIAGPGVGGVLVQLLTPPVAILADALSFVAATASLVTVRSAERPAQREETSVRREIADGMRVVWGNPMLRSLAGASATFNVFDSMLLAVYLLYMARTLGLGASVIGLVFGLSGAGGLLAALSVAPLTARIGVGGAIVRGIALAAAGELLIAGAGGPQIVAVAVLLAAEGAVELGAGLYSINARSLQQAVTPDYLRGRVSASMDFLGMGAGPLGAVAGGTLGEAFGLRQAVIVAGVGTLLSLLWVRSSPIRGLREMPVVE